MEKKKVLIAEDDRFLANAYKVKLDIEGFDVDVSPDGLDAIEKLKSSKYDLMILDLMMPKKDGFSVLYFMATDEQLRKIPVIVASNLGQQLDIDRAKKLGAKDYIIKSDSSMQVVLAKVRKAIENSNA